MQQYGTIKDRTSSNFPFLGITDIPIQCTKIGKINLEILNNIRELPIPSCVTQGLYSPRT